MALFRSNLGCNCSNIDHLFHLHLCGHSMGTPSALIFLFFPSIILATSPRLLSLFPLHLFPSSFHIFFNLFPALLSFQLHSTSFPSFTLLILSTTFSALSPPTSFQGATAKKRTYDLNTQTDPFFGRFAGSPFPEAVEANERELAEVSAVK